MAVLLPGLKKEHAFSHHCVSKFVISFGLSLNVASTYESRNETFNSTARNIPMPKEKPGPSFPAAFIFAEQQWTHNPANHSTAQVLFWTFSSGIDSMTRLVRCHQGAFAR